MIGLGLITWGGILFGENGLHNFVNLKTEFLIGWKLEYCLLLRGIECIIIFA